LKRAISLACGSPLIEEKHYSPVPRRQHQEPFTSPPSSSGPPPSPPPAAP
jgi:hypothetical protein